MNEEIVKRLSEAAKSRIPEGLLVEDWIRRYNQALIELVIQECVDVIPWEYDVEIRQHFGVDQ